MYFWYDFEKLQLWTCKRGIRRKWQLRMSTRWSINMHYLVILKRNTPDGQVSCLLILFVLRNWILSIMICNSFVEIFLYVCIKHCSWKILFHISKFWSVLMIKFTMQLWNRNSNLLIKVRKNNETTLKQIRLFKLKKRSLFYSFYLPVNQNLFSYCSSLWSFSGYTWLSVTMQLKFFLRISPS